MRTIVIMPGGFHPFHAGHMALYNSARKAFPDADLYVAATNSQEARPFPFSIKEKLAKVAGVQPGHFIQVKSPFQAKEITQNYDPEQDVLIFVRSEKDRNESPKPGGTKKDGTPAYFQPYTGKNMQPFSKHAYFAYLPTVTFGPGIQSATEIRKAWPTLDDRRKTAMVMSLYPATQKNPKLAANVVKMLDMGMGGQEGVVEGSIDQRIAHAKKNNPLKASVAKKTNGYTALVTDTITGKPSWFGGALWQTPELAMGHAKSFVKGFPHLEQEYAQRYIDKNRDDITEQGVAEGFDQPYPISWTKGDHGDLDALAKLPDGSPLSIMFNQQQDDDGDEITQVEFYRNNSQEVTGEGDAQRVFSTVLNAIQQYIKKRKPLRLTFAASKQIDPTVMYGPDDPQPNPESRAKLYDRLVQRYSKAWGYRAFRADNGDLVMYELSRMKPRVAEGSEPQVGDAVYYGKRLVGWFKGYSEHGKIITEPNYEEMGDEYANRDVYWDPQDKITIRPEQGVVEGAPIVVMPRSDRFSTKKPAQPYRNQGDIVPPTKPPSTEKRGVKGRLGQRPMPSVNEGAEEAGRKKSDSFDAIDPETDRFLKYAQQHYPNAPTKQQAFIKYVQRALRHSEEEDLQQDQQLSSIEQEIENIKKMMDKYQVAESRDYIEEK